MLKVNDIVLYGSAGACRVTDFCKKRIAGEDHDYAVLETQAAPITTIYLPLENKVLMGKIKPVLSREQMLRMIREIPTLDAPWIEDQEQRKLQYREALSGCDRIDLVRLVKTLYARQEEQRGQGRKLHSADERAFREAQRMLHNEIAFVLQISPDEVPALISAELSGTGLKQ